MGLKKETKRLLNYWRVSLALLVLIVAFLASMLILMPSATNNILAMILLSLICSFFSISLGILLVMSIEFITFKADGITSRKVNKTIEIQHYDIENITETEVKDVLGSTTKVWEICSRNGESIFLVCSPRRKKLIEELCSKCQITLTTNK